MGGSIPARSFCARKQKNGRTTLLSMQPISVREYYILKVQYIRRGPEHGIARVRVII